MHLVFRAVARAALLFSGILSVVLVVGTSRPAGSSAHVTNVSVPEGDAGFYGSMAGKPLNAPIVGIAETGQGGYYEVAADGGIFGFGPGAVFYGSLGGQPLNKPIVGMAGNANGYYEVASDGAVFAY